MTSLTTMMNWYADQETTERECIDCGDKFEVSFHNAGRKVRCDSCALIHDAERHQQDPLPPEFKLALAVIKSSRAEKDHDFIQNGGIQLWLRSGGIGVRPSMNKMIERMLR